MIHWNHFLALEEDLIQISRFIDFSGNSDTYSIEIAKLYLSACSEIDVVMKMLCKKVIGNKKIEGINKYYNPITGQFKEFVNFEVTIPKHNLIYQPWKDWTSNSSPSWWSDYNKVKHQRDTNYEKSNLNNLINSMSGLFVSVLYLYKKQAEKDGIFDNQKLFRVSKKYQAGSRMGKEGFCFLYKLP